MDQGGRGCNDYKVGVGGRGVPLSLVPRISVPDFVGEKAGRKALDDFACETVPLCHHWKHCVSSWMVAILVFHFPHLLKVTQTVVSLPLNTVDVMSWWYHLVCEILPGFPADSSPKPRDKIWDRKPGYEATIELPGYRPTKSSNNRELCQVIRSASLCLLSGWWS